MYELFQILFPVFGLILLGGLLRHYGFMDEAMEKAFNRFCYFFALPTFIVLKAAQSPALTQDVLKTAGGFFLVTLGLMFIGWLTSKLIRLPQRSRGTFIHAAFRGNLAYIGLPVIAFSLADHPESIQAQATSIAILTLAPSVLIYNLLGVMVLEWDRRHERTQHPIKGWLRSIVRNPLILSCALGFTWNALNLPVPNTLIRFGSPIASTAFPLALLAIGARIAGLSWKKGLLPACALAMVKNGFGLLIGLFVCRLLGFEGLNKLVILILSVCPTAVASYVLVDQLNGDRDLAASTIALSTLGSLFTLTITLWIILPL